MNEAVERYAESYSGKEYCKERDQSEKSRMF